MEVRRFVRDEVKRGLERKGKQKGAQGIPLENPRGDVKNIAVGGGGGDYVSVKSIKIGDETGVTKFG